MRICLPGGPSKLSPISIRYRPRKKLALPERLKRLHFTCVAQGNVIVMRYAEIVSLRFYCCRSRGRAVARDITVGTKFIKAYKTCRPCNWRAIKSCPENEDSRADDNASWSPNCQYMENSKRRLLEDVGPLQLPKMNSQRCSTTCLS
jgi:hypothetical protein